MIINLNQIQIPKRSRSVQGRFFIQKLNLINYKL